MKRNSLAIAMAVSAALWSAGCHREPSARSAATELQKAFESPAPAPAPVPAQNAAAPPPQGDEVKQAVSQAVSAIQTNGYAEAFFTLRAVQASPRITLDQYTAIQNARLAVERELAGKAAAGDPAALQALGAIQKSGH